MEDYLTWFGRSDQCLKNKFRINKVDSVWTDKSAGT